MSDPAGSDPAGSDPAGSDPAGSESVGPGSARRSPASSRERAPGSSGAPGPSGATGPSGWDVALRLLGVRARSRSEMRERLARRGFDDDTVADVMARLESAGLLDDEDFAAEWVRSRHTHSGRGRIALRHELKAKGVDADTIEGALSDIDPEDERAAAARLVAAKLTPRVIEELDDRVKRDKHFRRLVGMLVRRGYRQSMAIDVINEHLESARQQ